MTVDDVTTTALVERVRDVARTEIMPQFRRLSPGDIDAKSGPDDLVTVADRAAEAALAAALVPLFPGAEMVGEEAGGRSRVWHQFADRADRSNGGLFVTGGDIPLPWAEAG